MVTHSHLDLERLENANSFYLALGLTIAVAVHTRLTTRLIDESRLSVGSNIYEDIVVGIAEIHEKLNTLPAEG